MTPVAELRGVSFRWPDAARPALRDIDLAIDDGAFQLIVGKSGSGKSTLLRTLNGLVPHLSGGRFGGHVLIGGRNTRQFAPRDLAADVGFVFQDPEAQMLTDRVTDEIAFGMEQLGIDPRTMRKRVEEGLDLLDLVHVRDRSPADLSGGERQRLAIAAAMATHPRVLVLDEPLSQLDPWAAEDVVSALTRFHEDLGITIVMAEHRLERLLAHADAVRIMSLNGAQRDASPREAAGLLDPVALPAVTALARRRNLAHLPLTVGEARRSVDMASLMTSLRSAPCPRPTNAKEARILLDRVTVRLGGVDVITSMSTTFDAGSLTALMGRNGAGKTTLLRAIAGLVAPMAGTIDIPGDDRRVGYVPQRASALFYRERLIDELHATSRACGRETDVPRLLEEADLAWAADRHPSTLSVGERQRAAIATVLAGEPDVLLLDEPTRGMDPWHKRELLPVLERLRQRGVSIVMATHDTELVSQCADRVVLLGDGGIVAEGDPHGVLVDSLTFTTQINKVFGGSWLTIDEVLAARDTS